MTMEHGNERIATIRYSTGEAAQVGDRVIDDVWPAVVEDAIASRADMERWGVEEPGLMLKTEAAGLVFKPCSSVGWQELELVERVDRSLAPRDPN